MSRTVVGLFGSASEAQFATERLLAAGFERSALHLATSETLRAAELPAAEAEAPTEPLGTGFIRFFTDLFAGNENAEADARSHAAATHADSAVLTVRATTEDEANRARQLLDQNGALDVYKQAAPGGTGGPGDDVVDLEGSLSRVRDADGLDANGLTTH
ncbi:hypothetical protein [Hymenobacter properus]|uniref:Heat induced stress protein YflT n=1 Tax=Hymenobacter properus TaxID=2791026 RepID=A0A931BL22_9BACT|nr:hypothetical protein [Hymenobacter properus]MBF9144173.1 hypothetical protein [Hymenobacter properus]MBR7722989.1 hypothetical protein [Microvirga sp. SRT04]